MMMIIAPYVHKWEGGEKFHPVLIYYVMVKIILRTILSYNDPHITTCALVVGGRLIMLSYNNFHIHNADHHIATCALVVGGIMIIMIRR